MLQDLVARIMPKVAAHLEEHGVELSAITFGWFLSLFTDSLPIQVRLYSHSCHMGLAKLTLLSLADTAVLFLSVQYSCRLH